MNEMEEVEAFLLEHDAAICHTRTILGGWIAEYPYRVMSDDLKVACEIYHYQITGHPAWLGKLVDSLAWVVDKHAVWVSMDTLSDWMIIYRFAGATYAGHAGFMWKIDPNHVHRIKPLYEKYWKDYRHELI